MYKYTRKSTSQANSAHEKIKACNINYMNSKKIEYFHNFSLLNPLHPHLTYVTVEHVKKERVFVLNKMRLQKTIQFHIHEPTSSKLFGLLSLQNTLRVL